MSEPENANARRQPGERSNELTDESRLEVRARDVNATYGPRELCAWQVVSGLQETVAQVIEPLAEDENRVFVKSRNPNMVSTKKPPQAQPPSQKTMPLKEIATYPDTDENENLLYKVIRYEPQSFQDLRQQIGELP
jgi:hypothetical protein